jgi:hypothetical protein
MNTTPFRSAAELAGLIKAKKISSEDMLDLSILRALANTTRASKRLSQLMLRAHEGEGCGFRTGEGSDLGAGAWRPGDDHG